MGFQGSDQVPDLRIDVDVVEHRGGADRLLGARVVVEIERGLRAVGAGEARVELAGGVGVVGVAPRDRMRDYTKPGYGAYGRFLAHRLKPLVDQHLRTHVAREDTLVMGSSLGGVAALHIAWAHPEVFGRVACLSSTFGPMDDLFERIASEPRRPLLVYLDSGWPRDNYDATNAMRDLLISRGFRLGVDLLQFSFPQGLHDEGSWADRIHLPFQFFFGRAWRAQRGES